MWKCKLNSRSQQLDTFARIPMKHFRSQALILRIKEFGESDLLVSFFTPEAGILKGIAKAAKRSRKRFVNCLDHFCLVQLEYHSKKENQLLFLDACKLIDGFGQLRRDYGLLATASYLVELTETLFPLHVKEKKMFYLLKGSFERLCKGEALEEVRLVFEARAMTLGGYAIATERCCYCGRNYRGEGRAVFVAERGGISCLGCRRESERYPGMDPASVRALRQIQEPDGEAGQEPFLEARTIEEIKAVLEQHIVYRLGKKLKSREYLG